MPLSKQGPELARLVQSFEAEAAKFHPLTLTILFVTQETVTPNRPVRSPNHAIMLWQYYGALTPGADQLIANLETSDLQWGIRGAHLSAFALLEGESCDLFVRMAQRAGSVFDNDEALLIKSKLSDELVTEEQRANPSAIPVVV